MCTKTQHQATVPQHARANNSRQFSQLAARQRLGNLRRTHIRNLVAVETATHQQTEHIMIIFTQTIPLPSTPHCAHNHHSTHHAEANNLRQRSQLAVRQRRGNFHRTHIGNLVVLETVTRQQTKYIIFTRTTPLPNTNKPPQHATRGSENSPQSNRRSVGQPICNCLGSDIIDGT